MEEIGFMDNRIDIIKGIHPGKFIERELKKKNITQRVLAEDTDIPYQTINAIIAGRRNLGGLISVESFFGIRILIRLIGVNIKKL